MAKEVDQSKEDLLSRKLGETIAKQAMALDVEAIVAGIMEPKSLPVGMTEFEEWANRIILGSLLQADTESMKFTLASMILSLGPTESHKPDAYFIHGLRKAAANQIAHANQQAIHKAAKERLAKEELLKTIGSGGVVSLVKDTNEAVLDNKRV